MADVVTSADGIHIAYETYGEGTAALVFVHGWSCDRSYWEGQVQPFSRQFKVVAIDLAGHGESSLGRDAWTIGAFGDDVAAVVEKLDLERIIFDTHSAAGAEPANSRHQSRSPTDRHRIHEPLRCRGRFHVGGGPLPDDGGSRAFQSSSQDGDR